MNRPRIHVSPLCGVRETLILSWRRVNLNILFNYLMEMLPHSTWEGDTVLGHTRLAVKIFMNKIIYIH